MVSSQAGRQGTAPATALGGRAAAGGQQPGAGSNIRVQGQAGSGAWVGGRQAASCKPQGRPAAVLPLRRSGRCAWAAGPPRLFFSKWPAGGDVAEGIAWCKQARWWAQAGPQTGHGCLYQHSRSSRGVVCQGTLPPDGLLLLGVASCLLLRWPALQNRCFACCRSFLSHPILLTPVLLYFSLLLFSSL